MPRPRDIPLDCKVYVGDLPRDISEKDIQRSFGEYGYLRNVWVARNPPGFAFVEYEDSRDAEDAVRNLDGASMGGSRIRVEHSSGKVRPKPWMRRGPTRSRRPFNPDDRCFECGGRGHYAYDCSRSSRRRRSRHSRSRSRSRSRGRRSYSRSRSRSRSNSRSRSRSRDRHDRRKRLRTRSRSRSRSRSHSHHSNRSNHSKHSREGSPPKNDD